MPVGPFEFDVNESCVGSSGLIRLATLRPTRDNEAFCSFPAEARRICSYSILEALGRQINILDVGLMKCRDVRDARDRWLSPGSYPKIRGYAYPKYRAKGFYIGHWHRVAVAVALSSLR